MQALAMAKLVKPFMEIFNGQQDRVWIDTGTVDRNGRMVCEVPSRRPTVQDFYDHLTGRNEIAIGTYHYRDGMQSCYACIDIDDGSLLAVAKLTKAAHLLGLHAMTEISKGKGFHVWFFFKGIMPAVVVRNMLIKVCKVAEYEYDELYPKQIAGDVLGNVVRLPYAGRLPEKHRFFDEHGEFMTLDEFVSGVLWNRTSHIADVASMLELEIQIGEVGQTYVAWDGKIKESLMSKDFYQIFMGKMDVTTQRNNQFHSVANYLLSDTGARMDEGTCLQTLERIYEMQVPDKAGFPMSEVASILRSASIRRTKTRKARAEAPASTP